MRILINLKLEEDGNFQLSVRERLKCATKTLDVAANKGAADYWRNFISHLVSAQDEACHYGGIRKS